MATCKCANCGFLGRYSSANRELLEVDIVNRKQWRIVEGNDPFPVCSMQMIDLKEEWRKYTNDNSKNKSIPPIMERECEKFRKHNAGFSPKEHKEMMSLETIEHMRTEQRERDLRFQVEQRETDRRNRQEDQEEQRTKNEAFQLKMKRQDRLWAIGLAIVGATLTVLGTVMLVNLGFKTH